jgi:hypothetical protein
MKMEKIGNNKHFRLIDELYDVFLEGKCEPEDDLCIKESGIDFDSIVSRNVMLFRQLKTQTKAELNQAKFDRVLNFLKELQDGMKSQAEEYLKMAETIFSQPKAAELLPKYRNLTNISEQDKKTMLLDAKLLELLSEIEKEYNSQVENGQ